MEVETLAALAEKKISGLPAEERRFQEKHLALFRERGLKAPDEESYRYTNLETFVSELNPKREGFGVFDRTKFQDIPTVFIIDGKLEASHLNLKGVKVRALGRDFNHEYFPHPKVNAATHLHHSILSDGVIIEIERNAEVSEPIRVLNVSTHSEVTAPTVYINAGENSGSTFIEEHLSLVPGTIELTESYILVNAGARVEHIQIGNGEESLQHGATYAFVEKDGNFRSFIFNLAGKLNRRNLDLKLASSGANGESYNLYLTHGKEHSDISTLIEHLKPDTTSNQLAKGLLDGESKGIFTGKIHIHPLAQRVASGQLNKNLLLSKKAQAFSQPQLEIFADDVKCSHGSTTGQLSPDELFYFQARGIPAQKARTILAQGFALEVVKKIANKKACKLLSELVHFKLEQKFRL
jgi:Fe-S cluster assembly protein SufD